MSNNSGRVLRRVAAASSVIAVAGFVAAAPALAAGNPPGPIGSAVKIAHIPSNGINHPYDVAVTPSGTSYVGWIGSKDEDGLFVRTVNLCTLAAGTSSCSGGVQAIDGVPDTTADDPGSPSSLQLVATPTGVELWWSYNTASASVIAEANALHGQNLTAEPGDDRAVPLGSDLLDAVFDPDGNLWTVSVNSAVSKKLTVYKNQASQAVTAPVAVDAAQLAFSGKTTILAVKKNASFKTPVEYSTASGTGEFLTFHKVAGTWANGAPAMVHAGKGVRLLTQVNNATYRPVVANFDGNHFDAPHLTSDKSHPGGNQPHDAATDPSGRVADATWEDDKLTVTAYPDDKHAAVSRLKVGGTLTYAPQIGESTRGIATVAWSRNDGAAGSNLFVSHFRLGDVSRSAHDSAKGGSAVLTGPVNCLPVSNSKVQLKAHPAKGWKVHSREIDLDGKKVGKSYLDGANLDGGKSFTLSGSVEFSRKGEHSTAKATITFHTC
ncbi:hypothetical protein [Jatrophihabitans endophyticus]|uniref:hypothetical protein n=1 Tax=Jatrophihabitans endophyticus TaxID=1206085 RepID=UPI0019FE0181|nr:hypothetical protein [Jatrophihabitans endophyticus]MBE7186656.1 hypothetical protein [Jatrophihabitans endophyticus]